MKKPVLFFLLSIFSFSCSEKKGTILHIYIDRDNNFERGGELNINEHTAEIESASASGQQLEHLTVSLPENTSIRVFHQKTLYERADPMPMAATLLEAMNGMNMPLYNTPYVGLYLEFSVLLKNTQAAIEKGTESKEYMAFLEHTKKEAQASLEKLRNGTYHISEPRRILDLAGKEKDFMDSATRARRAALPPTRLRAKDKNGNLETRQPDEKTTKEIIALVNQTPEVQKMRHQGSIVSFIVITNNASEGFYDVLVNVCGRIKAMVTLYFFMVDLKEKRILNPGGDPVTAQKGYRSFSIVK